MDDEHAHTAYAEIHKAWNALADMFATAYQAGDHELMQLSLQLRKPIAKASKQLLARMYPENPAYQKIRAERLW